MKKYLNHTKTPERLTIEYGTLSGYLLLTKQYKEAEQAALNGLKQDPLQEWVNSNLVLRYVLQGKYPKAKDIYLKYKDKQYDDTRSWKSVFLNDLQDLEKAGITHPDFEKVKKLLEN